MKQTIEPRRFVQVSLSPEFATKLREQAEISDRSLASQLEHYAKIATAIEALLPAAALHELKAGAKPADVLARLGEFLSDPAVESLRDALRQQQGPVYSTKLDEPDVVFRRNADGTTTTGSFDSQGNFVPSTSTSPQTKESSHGPKATAIRKPQRRVDDRQEPEKTNQRTPHVA